MVVSHERSGTHFLMNSMAAAYEYVSDPWIDFDAHQVNINYFHSASVRGFFDQFSSANLAHTIKSHHHVDFFAPVIEPITRLFHILYIYRDPRDVMRSFWRYMLQWDWVEGPKCGSGSDFIRQEPMGMMMRYQFRQFPSILERWGSHVTGWLDMADLNQRVILVRFEDLRDRYAETIDRLGSELALNPVSHTPPDKKRSVIAPGTVSKQTPLFDEQDAAYFQERVGDIINRLGYPAQPQ